MHRIEEFKANLDVHWLKDLAKKYTLAYEEQIKVLLAKANSWEFNEHHKKVEEIAEFRKIIEEAIDDLDNLILNI